DYAYVWDRSDGSIALVSHAPGSAATPLASGGGTISRDGSAVVFSGQQGTSWESYVWHRATGDVQIASHDPPATGTPANAEADAVAISGDGRFVTFSSAATNLIPGGTAPGLPANAYLWDGADQQVTLLARRPPSGPTAGGGSPAAVSADGRFVAYSS